MFRDRREERRCDREADHYRMRQKLVSIGEDYAIGAGAATGFFWAS